MGRPKCRLCDLLIRNTRKSQTKGGDNLNRADKRILAREHQKIEKREAKKQKNLMEWFHSWTAEQKQFHKDMVSAMLDEVNEITEKVLDECYVAAIVDKLDLSLEQCEEVAEQANIYMIEVKRIIDEKKEGYFIMVKDEKLRSEIKEEAKIIIKENTKINNLRVIDALKENYDLPTKDFQIIIKEARKELESEKMEELESLITEESNIEVVKATVKEVQGAELKEEITADKTGVKVNGLKIKSIEIEGKYGIYVKDENGVTADGNPIKDIETLNREKEGYLKRQNELVKSTKDKIKELEENLTKLEADKEIEMRKCEEIEAVFAM